MRDKAFCKLLDRWLGIPLVLVLGLMQRLACKAPGRLQRPLQAGDRVLVMKLSALGDTLLLLPLLKALRQAVGPQGRIEVVATEVNREVLEDCPWLDAVLVLDLPRMFREPWFGWLFFKGLRSRGYNLALDMDQWQRFTPLACWAAGATQIVGFKTPGQHRHGLYLKSAPHIPGRHEFEQFKDVAALAGLDLKRVEAWPGFLARNLRLWKGGLKALPPAPPKAYLVLAPGCGKRGWQRAWPEDRWAALIQALAQRGWQMVLIGQGDYEKALVARLAQGSQALDLSGQLDYAGLLRLLCRASLVVCGNTGVMHLAAGLSRPLVALHGPTNPDKWGPTPPGSRGAAVTLALSANLACSPCLNLGFEYGCQGRACMEALEPWAVEQACLSALSRGARA